jgi:hypothetical protein
VIVLDVLVDRDEDVELGRRSLQEGPVINARPARLLHCTNFVTCQFVSKLCG